MYSRSPLIQTVDPSLMSHSHPRGHKPAKIWLTTQNITSKNKNILNHNTGGRS